MAVTVTVESGTLTIDFESGDLSFNPAVGDSFSLLSATAANGSGARQLDSEAYLAGVGFELSGPARSNLFYRFQALDSSSGTIWYYNPDDGSWDTRTSVFYPLSDWESDEPPVPDPVPTPVPTQQLFQRIRRKSMGIVNIERDPLWLHTTGQDFATGVFTLGAGTVPVRSDGTVSETQNRFKSYNNPQAGNRATNTGYALGAFIRLKSVTDYQVFRVKGRIVATGSSTTLVGFLFLEATAAPSNAAGGINCRYTHLDSAVGSEVVLDELIAFQRPATSPGPAVGLGLFVVNIGAAARPPRVLGCGSIQSLGVAPDKLDRAIS